jgi:acyl transferase domain-containing protein/phosphopantetheinyl transferase
MEKRFGSHTQPPAPRLQGDIAIIGMSCLFAGSPDLDTYWHNIVSKVDSITDPPPDEWDPKIFYDPTSKSNDRVYCKRGGYIGDLSQFRPMDFGIMPITVDGGEPDQWLALRVAHEALADAGYLELPKEHIRTEVILGKGTYINRGNITVGYHTLVLENFLQALRTLHPEHSEEEIQRIKDEIKGNLPPFSAATAPALIGNIIAGRIANRLDLMGSSFTVDAACASALLAIEIGVGDLLSGKCDLVLAGGSNVNTPLPTMGLFCQLGALSHNEKIRPFDKNADGTILGEGLGVIVLKRREDAERDGDRIYALIKGVGVASDGRALHVMAPRIEGEELALRRAYEMAGVTPDTVGLVEAHGTATPVGDVVEVQALGRVFGERQGPLPTCSLGSVKSMIGHTMPAAGIAGLIKAALALYHRVLPPTINCEEPNPALNLEKTPFHVNTETRPWVHGLDTPRRAGVNSFGFGGINAHVVLEEHPDEPPQARSHQLIWETEVFILEADSRNELIARGNRLKEYAAESANVSLKDLAFTLNTRLEGRNKRLAVIAASREDLIQKLTSALTRMASSQCRQIKDSSGIYFVDEPLQGKLAVLFPGEGAQYPNMLRDLCLHFPEVRRCFDLADRALMHSARNILPSDIIFPREILSEAERAELDKILWHIDGAVEGVLIGNWAIWTLLKCLEIRPDVIAGHSTGDYTAQLASRVINLNHDDFVEMIVAWNQAHSRLSDRIQVPEATLVAVAADAGTVMSIAQTVGGDLYLAMDNCPHQCVLAGTKIAAEQAIEQLRRRGIIYEVLPFDRPYHTPLFQEYAEGAEAEFFSQRPLSAPSIATYSCTSVDQYPTEVSEIRKLFIEHWVAPVRFTETVKKMYADGARIFVEAGPRGNLTSFVSDILRDKAHVAMPANVPRRSGITQIHHLIGMLAAQGVSMKPDYLYARRDPKAIEWESGKVAKPFKQIPAMKLALGLPPLKLSARERKPAARQESQPVEIAAGEPARPLPVRTSPVRSAPAVKTPAAQSPVVPEVVVHPSSPPPAPIAPRPETPRTVVSVGGGSAAVMQEYFQGMETFLDVESQVMEAFLNRSRGTAARIDRSSAPETVFPLLGNITSIAPGQKLVAHRLLTQGEDLFLRDHALGRGISITNPDLQPMVVMPLTMTMEILAEAASALMPGQFIVGMRDIQAHQWIRVDDSPVSLHITAQRSDPSNEVNVLVRGGTNVTAESGGTTFVEGVVLFADQYPSPPAPRGPLTDGYRSVLNPADLYDGRYMFHGPCFQGVKSIDTVSGTAIAGQLRVLPAEPMFRSIPNPRFVTDPVLLDAAGQLVGFWAAEHLRRGFVVFPYHLDELRIFGPNRPVGEGLTCRVDLETRGNDLIHSDIEIAGSDGQMWMQLRGWADRRFDPPAQFHAAWISPREKAMSQPWQLPMANFDGDSAMECHRLQTLFPPGAALWKDLWASLILTKPERDNFAAGRATERRQLEWLSGRTVAKDAVRSFLKRHYGLELLPADIEIAADEHGKPVVTGSWTQQVPAVPVISLSHTDGVAVALVAEGGQEQNVGIDIQAMRAVTADFESLVLSPEEQRLLKSVKEDERAEWLLRIWCAKEAASKALGLGLIEGPSSVRILSLDVATGIVEAIPQGKLATAVGSQPKVISRTAREDAYLIAICVYQRRIV